ncbi:MAG TPA: ATP synthase F1 subunit delta [Bacteroidales bacterium]|jgi:F-type H+-transporting ATPase subunit delta|nr:ATP synthase F1 subunit delta [Bacteroidota bacterium]HJN06424.1 ATP synthase F1 subunit delta [Bacteroidales bacterium]|tara:strand:- start:524 stop:1081 length:558 start_codon:yes stop_codon:yes gene_type:complete
MRVKLLSKRYAQALFNLAVELNVLEKVVSDLKLIGKVFSENRELRIIIANPVIDAYKKSSILNQLFKDNVQELTIKFLQLITAKGREKYIPYISEAFNEIYLEFKNILSVDLTTAQKAQKVVTDDISNKLHKATNMNIELTEKVDGDIIGGFVVNFQDYKYDASIINQLNKLKKDFSENLYETQF